MGATSSKGSFTGTTDFELLEGAVYPARGLQVIDLGTHKNTHPQAAPDAVKREVMIIWEISGEKMADGRPFVVNKRYTNSLNEKAILRKELASWRGRDFTNEELECFELGKILNAPCMINVTKTAGKKDAKKFYNNVMSVMPLAKGMACEPLVNETVDFGIEDRHNDALMQKIYPWVRAIIAESYEAKGIAIPGHEVAAPKEEENPNDFGDEIPF